MIKRLNNAKRQTNYLVCNIEVSATRCHTLWQVSGSHPRLLVFGWKVWFKGESTRRKIFPLVTKCLTLCSYKSQISNLKPLAVRSWPRCISRTSSRCRPGWSWKASCRKIPTWRPCRSWSGGRSSPQRSPRSMNPSATPNRFFSP